MKIYKRTELSRAQQRFIRRKEEQLNKECRKIWEHTNIKGERYIFGRFGKVKEGIIVTIACYNESVHMFVVSQ